ncbi:kinase-like domain-containing protein [Hysterangium stoloniferum]|nr:kinase-like domain-containing protein [Hysterangium stoloniferum]
MSSLFKKVRHFFRGSPRRPVGSYHEISIDNVIEKKTSLPDCHHQSVRDPTGAPIKLLGRLGSGKFSQVVLGQRDGRIFAIKSYNITKLSRRQASLLNGEQNLLRKFAQEFRHPFIIALQMSFVYLDHIFLAMHWCPETLATRLISQISVEEAVLYTAQLLSAVEHLHSLGIIHRDIKPENILLDECGNIQLADFGISYRFDLSKEPQSQKITDQALRQVGTPAYMAPETNSESSAPVSYASDIYSYGRVFMEISLSPAYLGLQDVRSRKFALKSPMTPSSEKDLYCAATRHRSDMRPTARELMGFSYFYFINWAHLVKNGYTNPHKPQFPKGVKPMDVDFCRRVQPEQLNGTTSIRNCFSGLFLNRLVFVSPQLFGCDYPLLSPTLYHSTYRSTPEEEVRRSQRSRK